MSAGLHLDQLLRAAVAGGVAPAMAFGIARPDHPPLMWFAGREGPRSDAPATSVETRFDLASLTKPLTTTLWVLRLIERGDLDLERPIGALVQVHDAQIAGCPLWRLMNHTAGLPVRRPYFAGLGPALLRSGRFDRARASLRRMLAGIQTEQPPGRAEVYSDPGYLLLEWAAEAADRPLGAAWPELPGHGPMQLYFRPCSEPPRAAPGHAPTERCALRERLLYGEVHDENAWIMGGIAGHAGLFGTLPAVLDMGLRWLRALDGDGEALGITPALARAAVDRRWMHPRGTRVLGWDTPTPGRSASGTRFGRSAFGHLGFTGTSIWIDPEREVVMALLTNRVSPSRENWGIRAFRPRMHDAAWQWLDGRFT